MFTTYVELRQLYLHKFHFFHPPTHTFCIVFAQTFVRIKYRKSNYFCIVRQCLILEIAGWILLCVKVSYIMCMHTEWCQWNSMQSHSRKHCCHMMRFVWKDLSNYLSVTLRQFSVLRYTMGKIVALYLLSRKAVTKSKTLLWQLHV